MLFPCFFCGEKLRVSRDEQTSNGKKHAKYRLTVKDIAWKIYKKRCKESVFNEDQIKSKYYDKEEDIRLFHNWSASARCLSTILEDEELLAPLYVSKRSQSMSSDHDQFLNKSYIWITSEANPEISLHFNKSYR